jgi:hypothetical protein
VTTASPPLLLLGPQLRTPSLAEALRAADVAGPLLAITAGWQEREAELGALEAHLGQQVEDLRLYARTEALFAADPVLADAYRARQAALRELQDLYRLRLDHAKAAAREVWRAARDSELRRRSLQAAIEALRTLDREHLADIARLHDQFAERLQPLERPALRAQLAQVRARVAGAGCVLLAGGHVAVLLNRLRLFDAASWLRDRPLAAWSAGAMALGERVVLFHDHPPQGAGNAEVFEAGLGLVRGLLPLPHARSRLALADSHRVGLLARRFAPDPCVTLDHGDWLRVDGPAYSSNGGPRRLGEAGGLLALGVAA